MIKALFNSILRSMHKRYDYDVSYMQEILMADLGAFLKMMAFQTMAAHQGKLSSALLYAARLRAIIWDDCGPCTQLITNMALEAKLSPDLITAIIDRDLSALPEDVALVVRFTELVLAHHPSADDLREEIRTRWGTDGLISIAYAISSTRVYPALKYAMGYGNSCSRILVANNALVPTRDSDLYSSHGNA